MSMGLWDSLGIAPGQALVVVLSAIGIALVLLLLMRLLGQRSIARMTTFDVAILLVLGSAGGRVITGYTPSLAAGVLALVILVLLRGLADSLARTAWGVRLIRNKPLLLVREERIIADNLKRARVSDGELWEALRLAGIRNLSEVALVIFESTGSISVIRKGAPLDPRLLKEVKQ